MNPLLPSAVALAAAAALVSAALPASAQPRTLTWPELVALANEHPRIREAEARAAAARAGVRAAGAIPNPSLEATLGRGTPREGVGAARLEQSLALAVPLDWLALRGPRLDVARANLAEARAQAALQRREVLAHLGELFWGAAFAQAQVASLEQLEAQTAEIARLVRVRVDEGESRPIEALRIETELERVRNDLAEARSRQESNRRQMELWVRGLAGGDWRIDGSALEALPEVPDLASAQAHGSAEHAAVKAAEARVRAADAEASTERRQRIPSLALRGFVAEELDRRSVGAGIELTLPVWNWNSGRIAQLEATRDAEQRRLDAQVIDVLAATSDAHGACSRAEASARRYRDQILPRAGAAAQTLERSFQLGETALLDVLDARRVLGETRRGFLAALLQAQLDCNRLQLLMGGSR